MRENNVLIKIFERGKLVGTREGHNVWVDRGRQYLAEMVGYATISADVPERNERLRYMQLGIGSQKQNQLGMANTSPIITAYPPEYDPLASTYLPLSKSLDLNNDAVNEIVGFADYTQVDFEWNDPFALSIWVNFAAASNFYVFAKRDHVSPSNGYMLAFTPLGYVRLLLDAGTPFAYSDWNTNVGDGAWHHILVASNGSGDPSQFKCYIDGADQGAPDVATGTISSGTLSSSNALAVGGLHPSLTANMYVGKVCHSAVYSKLPTSDEVAAIFGEGSPQDLSLVGPTNNLVHWCPLGDGCAVGANNMVDLSTYAEHGTTYNVEVGDFVSDVPVGGGGNKYNADFPFILYGSDYLPIGTLERPVRISGGSTPYPGNPGTDLWLIDDPNLWFTHTAYNELTVHGVVDGSAGDVIYSPFTQMPLSEVGLLVDETSVDPDTAYSPVVAYFPFDTILFTSAIRLEFIWTVRF